MPSHKPTNEEAELRQRVTLDPDDFEANMRLALMLCSQWQFFDAEICAQNAVRVQPNSVHANAVLGNTLCEAQRPQMGEPYLRKAIQLNMPDADPETIARLALCLQNQGRFVEARQWYYRSTKVGEMSTKSLSDWARLEEDDKKYDAAISVINRIDARNPTYVDHIITHADLLWRMNKKPESSEMLSTVGDRLLTSEGISYRGRLLDKMGRHDEAFIAFEAGKLANQERMGHEYQDACALDSINRIKAFFTPEMVTRLPRAKVHESAPQPIFILGFPRSGTTLVEQILSSHPLVSPGDELRFINYLASLMGDMINSAVSYPEALYELVVGDQRSAVDNLRDWYLSEASKMDILKQDKPWFTDKMPLNETGLGLIHLIFPKSPLLHVIRHPLDVVVSAMSYHSTHGWFCLASMESIATHFVRNIDLVQHYRNVIPDLNYRMLRYEDIIKDPEGMIRAALDFVGIAFDPACLSFHENKRYARTPSQDQVTEPLYDRSVGRYKNYLKQLEPIIPMMRPTIERLGYVI